MMAISLFGAEFLIHPAPLEYSAYRCEHNCAYCFANIRNKNSRPDLSLVYKQLSMKSKSQSLANTLIKLGYPICISNRTDPFTKNNLKTTLMMCEYLSKMKNGIFFQTRGFNGLSDAVKVLRGKKNVVLYVSCTSTDNSILSKIEPGAPTIEKRIAAMEMAKSAGWSVICAVNPCSEEMMPQKKLIELENTLTSIGIKHFIFQRLRLNKADIKVMPEWKIAALGKDIIDKAVTMGVDTHYADQVIRQREKGLHALAFGMPYPTRFFDEIWGTLGKHYKNNYAFYNYVEANQKESYTFDEYYKTIIGENADIEKIKSKEFVSYILNQNRSVWKDSSDAKNAIDIKKVLKVFWNERRMSGSPQNNAMMIKTGDLDRDGNIILTKNPKKLKGA